MGRLLVDQDLVPDVIHCSSAVRTRSTVESMWNNGQFTGDLRHHAALYEAAVDDVELVLRSTSDGADRVLIVGHNPTMEELVARLTGQWERMPTATLAHIQLSIETWSGFTVDCRGTLADLWRPRELSA